MEKMTFEKAAEELEKIIQKLEDGDAELSESLKLFERGVELSAYCSKLLDEAQQKIGLLTRGDDGKMKAKAFDTEVNNA